MRFTGRSQINKMVRIIRDKKAVTAGEMCLIMNLAPSTIYQYARAIKRVFLDISFENGIFSCEPSALEKLTAQKFLDS